MLRLLQHQRNTFLLFVFHWTGCCKSQYLLQMAYTIMYLLVFHWSYYRWAQSIQCMMEE